MSVTKICRVCGKEYEYCHKFGNTDKYRWQDVACSPECGAEYFRLIEESRAAEANATSTPQVVDDDVDTECESCVVSEDAIEDDDAAIDNDDSVEYVDGFTVHADDDDTF